MAKGFFSQGAAILLARPTTLDAIAPLLAELEIVKRVDDTSARDVGGPSVVVPFRPEVNGYVSIDLQDRPWPDHMGDPAQEPMLFGAWSMGHFGPFAYPGNLERASQQAWDWPEAKQAVASHRAFLRVRTSYIFGARDQDPVIPADCDPLAELVFATRVARALLRHPDALAYFNPNGETVKSDALIAAAIERQERGGPAALEVWTNVRLLNPGNGWWIMDTVGMAQLDRPDCEACFADGAYEPNDVARFLRNAALYLVAQGDVIRDGDTIDGPGGVRWRAHDVEDGLAPPPRRVLRWFPEDGSEPPQTMTRSG